MGEFFLSQLERGDGTYYEGVNNLTVILMGVGIVFVGLISLIIICSITGAICKALIKEKPAVGTGAPAVAESADEIPNRGEFVAAVSAAIAEASGTDAAGIRIIKIEKK